jgi:isochorismate synthase
MALLTTRGTAKLDVERLRTNFSAAAKVARQRGRATVVSTVLSIPAIDPLTFFARGADLAQTRVFWSSQDQRLSLAGVNAAWMTYPPNPLPREGRGNKARETVFVSPSPEGKGPGVRSPARAWQELTAEALIDAPARVDGTGPILLGGFTFDPLRPATPAWAGYPERLLFLPRCLLTVSEGETCLTINAVLSSEADVEQELASALKLVNQLLPGAGRDTSCCTTTRPPDGLHTTVEDLIPAERWQAIVAGAVRDLERLGLEKVVLARACRVRGNEPFDAVRILEHLRAAYPSCFVFALARGNRCFLGATPEQLVSLRSGLVRAMSLAGSIARGAGEEEDQRLANALIASGKERAEHGIVVRAIREELAALGTGDVACGTPVVLKLPNVQHLQTAVTARTDSGRSILDLVERLHPTPAVGGYPREPALQLIREREDLDRGWYAGPIGWLDAHGEGEFAVALRSALISGDEALLFAGCGIVPGSDPASEYAESCLKLRPMLTALGAIQAAQEGAMR